MTEQNRKPASAHEPTALELESVDLLIRISRITNIPFDSFLAGSRDNRKRSRTAEEEKAEADELVAIFNTIYSAYLRKRLIAIARLFAGKEPHRN